MNQTGWHRLGFLWAQVLFIETSHTLFLARTL